MSSTPTHTALPAVSKVFSSCLAIVSAVMVGGLFVAGPAIWNWLSDSLRDAAISRDSFKRSLKTFLFSTYYFQLTRVHNASELFGRCALQIYLLTYLCTHYLSLHKLHNLYQLSPTMLRLACNISRDRYHPVSHTVSSCEVLGRL